MTGETLRLLLPEVYSGFLPRAFDRERPPETRATCARCAMCPPEGGEQKGVRTFFDPATKCCTYVPAVANYLVGGLLEDDSSPEGQHRVRQAIRARVGVTPLGLAGSQRDRLLYRQGAGVFGHARSLRCPYYRHDTGTCTVWSFREAICATFFCKHDEGEEGRLFWEALGEYLRWVQATLAAHALQALGWPAEKVLDRPADADLTPEEVDQRPPDEKTYEATWGKWVGREEDLFVAAYRRVRDLQASAFERLGGVWQDLLLRRVIERHDRLREIGLPSRLRRAPLLQVEPTGDGRFVVGGHSLIDPVAMRRELFDLLGAFDGQLTTSEARERIRRESGTVLSDQLVLKLHRFRILVAG